MCVLGERQLVYGRDREALAVVQVRQTLLRFQVQDVLRSGGRKTLPSAAPAGVVGHGLRERVRRQERQSLAETLLDPQRRAMVIRKTGGLLFEDVLQRYDDALLDRHRHQASQLVARVSDVTADAGVV